MTLREVIVEAFGISGGHLGDDDDGNLDSLSNLQIYLGYVGGTMKAVSGRLPPDDEIIEELKRLKEEFDRSQNSPPS